MGLFGMRSATLDEAVETLVKGSEDSRLYFSLITVETLNNELYIPEFNLNGM